MGEPLMLRPTARPTYASAEVVRTGKRLANLVARPWQDPPDRPVAIAMTATRST